MPVIVMYDLVSGWFNLIFCCPLGCHEHKGEALRKSSASVCVFK